MCDATPQPVRSFFPAQPVAVHLTIQLSRVRCNSSGSRQCLIQYYAFRRAASCVNPLVHVNAISRKKSGRPHCIEQREEHYRVVILVESSRHSSLQLAEFKSLKYERATAESDDAWMGRGRRESNVNELQLGSSDLRSGSRACFNSRL